ncbi:hypothetical protein BT63DRAFT_190111 [Microthyrium microscopicum]|uniref:DUF1275 domain protein n=1 Tax=Microthyrium microscopicum TaxID=703497 RepID=A0A6A6UM66_9PEZI|nr:hypothetical protein BT63DRAFT_190111 [Microthyrium microscopicum]
MSSPSYGTTNNSHPANANGNDEITPLLNSSNSGRNGTKSRSIGRHMRQNISTRHADIVLLVCYTVTGLLDSSSISIWQSFVSMQTGNTVYLGLGLANPSGGTRWIKAATSVFCFCFGSFIFARYHRAFSPRKRWVLVSSHIFQTFLIMVAALIVMYDPADGDFDKSGELRWQVLVPIALVAFQAAGQAVTSRALKFNALTSVVLTSIYCDLFSDMNLFAELTTNVERNQRATAPVALLVGAIAGGLWAKSDFGMKAALWTAAGLKACIVLAWILWKGEKEEDE